MAPNAWPPDWLRVFCGRCGACSRRAERATRTTPRTSTPDALRCRWHRAAAQRRVVLLGLVIAQTVIATDFMGAVLPYHGTQPLEIASC